jgi:hypothetical protein
MNCPPSGSCKTSAISGSAANPREGPHLELEKPAAVAMCEQLPILGTDAVIAAHQFDVAPPLHATARIVVRLVHGVQEALRPHELERAVSRLGRDDGLER